MSQLTAINRQVLKDLETKPKSKAQEIAGSLVSLMPIAMGAITLLCYWFVPNHGANKTTNVYPTVLLFFMGLLFIRFVAGFFSQDIREKLRYKAPLYTAVFALLLLYDFATLKTGKLALPYFTWPDQILNAMIDDRLLLLECVYHSLLLLFTGYLIGALAGIVTGVLAGCSRKVYYWVAPVMKVLGPIPSTTWMPIVLIISASLFRGSVFLIALGVWYPVVLATLTGITNVKKSYFEVADTLGARPIDHVTHVAIPAAMPSILQGLTQGMSVACTALMVAEMLGVEAGLGWYITWQKGWAEFARVYAAVIIICIIFVAVTKVLDILKRRLLHWQKGVGQ